MAHTDQTTTDRAWKIAPPSLGQYLSELKQQSILPPDAQFSLLKNAVRDVDQIAELAAATGTTYASSLVTFPPERLALFETCAIVETEVQLREEDDLAPVVKSIYENDVLPQLRSEIGDLQKQIETQAEEWAKASIERVKAGKELPEDVETKKMYETIQARIKSGAYKPGEYSSHVNEDSALQMVIQDKKYNQLMKQAIAEFVSPIVNKVIDDKSRYFPMHDSRGNIIGNDNLQRLSLHSGENRHTFMFAGAPACGKGTAVGMMVLKAESLGIDWSDTVKINTDVHRGIVSSPDELGANREWHSELNNDEAYFITERANQLINDKIKAGKAPHMLVDGVYPSPGRLKLGTEGGGKVHLSVVTVPVETSVERAYFRGVETGRFVTTSYLVGAHQSVSNDLHKHLATFKGQNIEYEIYDTDVPRGTLPIRFEAGDLKKGEVQVYDMERAERFNGKKNANPKAQSKDEVFLPGTSKVSRDFMTTLQSSGIKVDIHQPTPQVVQVASHAFTPLQHALSKQPSLRELAAKAKTENHSEEAKEKEKATSHVKAHK